MANLTLVIDDELLLVMKPLSLPNNAGEQPEQQQQ